MRRYLLHPAPRRAIIAVKNKGGPLAFIRNPKDFWAGLLFIGLGIAAIAVGSKYNLGTAARMGPGYFPRILGILLLVLGTIITLRGLRGQGERVPPWKWRPTLVVLLSVVGFGLIMAKVGMAISTVLLIVAASAASHEFRPKEALIAGVLLAALSVGVFIVALHVQLPIWPEFSR
jgi:Tripartite tricarboxylate transporter TctB family